MTKKGSLDFLFLIYYIESRRRLRADSALKELLSALCAVYQIFIVAEHTEGYFEFQGIGEVRMINGKLDRVLHTFASH